MFKFRPYVIYTPVLEANTTSGGVRVLWGLYGHLLAKGMVAYTNVKLNTHDFVAIYPEIMHGNEGEADYVVRYILNKPGVMGGGTHKKPMGPGPTEFDKTDELYYFSRLFGKAKDEKHYMFLPILNMQLFKPQGKKRTKKCVYLGKDFDLHKHPKDCIYITRDIWLDQTKLADLLNECQVMYCYDRVTAMTEIARLCGCRIVMINPVYTKDEFREYEPGMNGISWDKDEGVPLDVRGFRYHYASMKRLFCNKLNDFIERTQK
jgi:hypothetical protein